MDSRSESRSENCEGCAVSMATVRMRPSSMCSRISVNPWRSIASSKQLPIVSLTSGWSGMRMGPVRFSAQAT